MRDRQIARAIVRSYISTWNAVRYTMHFQQRLHTAVFTVYMSGIDTPFGELPKGRLRCHIRKRCKSYVRGYCIILNRILKVCHCQKSR